MQALPEGPRLVRNLLLRVLLSVVDKILRNKGQEGIDHYLLLNEYVHILHLRSFLVGRPLHLWLSE